MSCGLVKALVCHRLSVIDQVFDRSWWTSRQATHWIVGGLQGEVTQEVGETWSLWPAAVQIQRVSSGRFAGSSLQSSRGDNRSVRHRFTAAAMKRDREVDGQKRGFSARRAKRRHFTSFSSYYSCFTLASDPKALTRVYVVFLSWAYFHVCCIRLWPSLKGIRPSGTWAKSPLHKAGLATHTHTPWAECSQTRLWLIESRSERGTAGIFKKGPTVKQLWV